MREEAIRVKEKLKEKESELASTKEALRAYEDEKLRREARQKVADYLNEGHLGELKREAESRREMAKKRTDAALLVQRALRNRHQHVAAKALTEAMREEKARKLRELEDELGQAAIQFQGLFRRKKARTEVGRKLKKGLLSENRSQA